MDKKLIAGLVAVGVVAVMCMAPSSKDATHSGISATTFWVGQPVGAHGSKASSAWNKNWEKDFGGVDDPKHRQNQGYWPQGFTPRLNTFYVQLPYNDLAVDDSVKTNVDQIPWYDPTHPPTTNHSVLEGHWVEIDYGNRKAYAQWEDVGPAGDNDPAYVFGSSRPAYAKSGIGVSPAVTVYLRMGGTGVVSWRFVNTKQVPDGPWLSVKTN